MTKYNHLVEAMQQLKERGFEMELQLKDGKMYDPTKDKYFDTNDLQIVEHHRFEGYTNPSDMSILFAVISNEEEKGLIVSSFGVYGDLNVMEFMDKVKVYSVEEVN